MVKTKFELITALQRKVRPLLPKDVDYDNIQVDYNGKILNWNQILYRICECELKRVDSMPNLVGHFTMRYFRDNTQRMWDKEVPRKGKSPISWRYFAEMLNTFFREHRENLKLWKAKFQQITNKDIQVYVYGN